MPMTFDPHRDDDRRNVEGSSIQYDNATLGHDGHDPRGQSCGAATLPWSVTAPERWNMGPTLHDADAAMDQRSRTPSPHSSLMISQSARKFLSADPSGQDPSSTPTRWIIVLSPGLPSFTLHCRRSIRRRPKIGERSGETGSLRDPARAAISVSLKAAMGRAIAGGCRRASRPG
jgi:hypothetical protein